MYSKTYVFACNIGINTEFRIVVKTFAYVYGTTLSKIYRMLTEICLIKSGHVWVLDEASRAPLIETQDLYDW